MLGSHFCADEGLRVKEYPDMKMVGKPVIEYNADLVDGRHTNASFETNNAPKITVTDAQTVNGESECRKISLPRTLLRYLEKASQLEIEQRIRKRSMPEISNRIVELRSEELKDLRKRKTSMPQTRISFRRVVENYLKSGDEQLASDECKDKKLMSEMPVNHLKVGEQQEVPMSRKNFMTGRVTNYLKFGEKQEGLKRKKSFSERVISYLNVGEQQEVTKRKNSSTRVIRRLKTGDNQKLRERRRNRLSLSQKMNQYFLSGEDVGEEGDESRERISFFDIVKLLPKKLFKRKDNAVEDFDLSEMPRRFYHRRNAVQMLPITSDYTIKNGCLKLWIDTVSPEELQEFKEVFSIYDKDNDGAVHSKELVAILKNYGQNPTEDEIHDIMLETDTDQSGLIEFPEFVTLMAKRRSDSAEDMRQAFEAFDENGDGKISAEELTDFLSNTGEGLSPELIAEIMTEADLDGDGYIDYQEFVEMMKTG